jgi:L-ascorbate metabolism protein UlaG (beta-lactamase superfamily)
VSVRLVWLGQASVRLELDGTRLLVDPWYSPHESRLIPIPDLEDAAGADAILITHEHLDHLDEPFLPTLRERSPHARVILPRCLTSRVDGVFESVAGVEPGDKLEIGGIAIDVVPAYHGVSTDDAYGDGSSLGEGPRFVGYVIRGAGAAVYHAGDTIATAELSAALARVLPVDVALLPVNGRDHFRERAGIVGNLDAREAVELALEIGAHTLVPLHWDGFAGNVSRPGEAADAADGRIHVVVPARGRQIELA